MGENTTTQFSTQNFLKFWCKDSSAGIISLNWLCKYREHTFVHEQKECIYLHTPNML